MADLEAPAVEIVGTERLTQIPRGTVDPVGAVFPVAKERMSDGRHMSADLMSAAGEKIDLHQAELIDRRKHLVMRADGLAVFGASAFNIDAVLLLVFFQKALKGGFGGNRRASILLTNAGVKAFSFSGSYSPFSKRYF